MAARCAGIPTAITQSACSASEREGSATPHHRPANSPWWGVASQIAKPGYMPDGLAASPGGHCTLNAHWMHVENKYYYFSIFYSKKRRFFARRRLGCSEVKGDSRQMESPVVDRIGGNPNRIDRKSTRQNYSH